MVKILHLVSVGMVLTILPVVAEDWTVNGKAYRNVMVGQVEADRVHITYDGGVGTVALADLSPGLQKRFNYNTAQAKAAADARAQHDAASDAIAYAVQTKESATAAQPQIPAEQARVAGIVIEKCYGGYLINCNFGPYYVRPITNGNRSPEGRQPGFEIAANAEAPPSGWFTGADDQRPKLVPSGRAIFLVTNRDMVDDDRVDLDVVLVGEYNYRNTVGSTNTVKKYAEAQ